MTLGVNNISINVPSISVMFIGNHLSLGVCSAIYSFCTFSLIFVSLLYLLFFCFFICVRLWFVTGKLTSQSVTQSDSRLFTTLGPNWLRESSNARAFTSFAGTCESAVCVRIESSKRIFSTSTNINY